MKISNIIFNRNLISVSVNGADLDLHNNYDFIGLDKNKENVRLYWKRAKADWVSLNDPEILLINFINVLNLDIRGNIQNKELDEFGFFENDTEGKVEYNGTNTPTDGANLLLFRFSNNFEIAITAEEVSGELPAAV